LHIFGIRFIQKLTVESLTQIILGNPLFKLHHSPILPLLALAPQITLLDIFHEPTVAHPMQAWPETKPNHFVLLGIGIILGIIGHQLSVIFLLHATDNNLPDRDHLLDKLQALLNKATISYPPIASEIEYIFGLHVFQCRYKYFDMRRFISILYLFSIDKLAQRFV